MYEEFSGLSMQEALEYCAGSEQQRVRGIIAGRAGVGKVIDLCCGNGIDAHLYAPSQYLGVDISPVLISAASRLHPGYVFMVADASDLQMSLVPFASAVIKSALEHVPSEDIAIRIVREACRVAQHVYVAWHTPPVEQSASQIITVPGHNGRRVYQNRYAVAAFAEFKRTEEQIDNFTLWTIRGNRP